MSFQKQKVLTNLSGFDAKAKETKKSLWTSIELNHYDGRFGSKIALTISIWTQNYEAKCTTVAELSLEENWSKHTFVYQCFCFALPPLRNLQSFFQRNECASKQLSTILFIVALGAGQGGGANRYSSWY